MSAGNPFERRAAAHEPQAPPQPPPAFPEDPVQQASSVPYPTRAAYLAEQNTQVASAGPDQVQPDPVYAEQTYAEQAYGAQGGVTEESVTYEEESQYPTEEPTFDPDSLGADSLDPGALGEDASGPTVIRTDMEGVDGLNKCLRCGATDISLNPNTGKLRCHFCRSEWDAKSALETMGLDTPIEALKGLVMGSGAGDIIPSTDIVVTFIESMLRHQWHLAWVE